MKGIGRKRAGPSKRHLVEQFVDELGKVPDMVVAKKAGVSIGTVYSVRTEMGIPGYRAPKKGKKGSVKAKRTPKKTSKPKATKAAKPHQLDAYKNVLGTMPDQLIADAAGVSRALVTAYRNRQGIESTRPRKSKKTESPARAAAISAKATTSTKPNRTKPKRRPSPAMLKIAEHHDLVGVLPDGEIAAKAGVNKNSVWNYRRKHGIAGAGKKQHGKATTATRGGNTAGGLKTQTQAQSWAWEATFENGIEPTTRIVIGADVSAASSRAAKAGLGDVTQLRRMLQVI